MLMKRNLISMFLAIIGMIVGTCGAMADDVISCSAYLTSTAGSPNLENCTLAANFNGNQVPGGTNVSGTDYYYAKMNNNANYYEITLSQTVGDNTYSKFVAGDIITVYLYSYGTTVSYLVGSTSMTAVTKTNQTKGNIIEVPHTLTAAEIEEGGSLKIFRNSSNTYFAGISIEGTRIPSDLLDCPLTVTSSKSLNIAIGETSSITYSSESSGTVSYTSSNSSVASVSEQGVITAVSGGTATITVSQEADATYNAGTSNIAVTVPYSVTSADSYKIDNSTYGFSDASFNYYFTNGFSMSNSNSKSYNAGSTSAFSNSMKFSAGVTYTINIPDGVSVYYATVKAKSNYKTTDNTAYWGTLFGNDYSDEALPCSDEDGYSEKTIYFEQAQTGTLTFTPKGHQVLMAFELFAIPGKSESDLTLISASEVSLDAETTTSQITTTTSATVDLTYTSSNTSVATVSSTGLITAVANGTAVITVSQKDDENYLDDSKTVNVTVNNGVTPSYKIAAILNNETSSMLTSEEQVQGTAVSFGVNSSNERVDADASDAVVIINGTYHSEHGLTGLVATVNATGNMKITIGNCTYNNSTLTVKNSSNETVASASLDDTGCWKGGHSDSTTVYYEGAATILTVSVPSYCPYIAVESVGELTKYTVTFMNGDETVSTKQVVAGEGIGSLPTPTYDTTSKRLLGWYSDTSDLGTKVTSSTVPTGDVTYYAMILDIPTTTAGYYMPSDGAELLNVLDYVQGTSTSTAPAKIFLKNGTYDWGTLAENVFSGSYVSLIGESLDGTIITNTPTQEGLGTATLFYNKGEYNYLQDLTLKNNYPFGDSTGRAASLKDEGNYTICKNVWLYSHQDTYYSHKTGGYFYFNGGKISGCVDYMCGQSRVYYEGVTLANDNRSTYMTANSELYVFNNCIIENGGSTYTFGRSWSSVNDGPYCIFLNTTLMDDGENLASTRWTTTSMNAAYALAGEYGTKDSSGEDITPTSNVVTFSLASSSMETILTDKQAAEYTMAYTLGDWATTAASDVVQATVSDVTLSGSTLSWTGTSDAYLIEKNGEFVALTTENSYTVDAKTIYTVRAANARGGFGEGVSNESCTITYNIASGSDVTSLSSTQSSSDSRITELTGISATTANAAGSGSGKTDLSVKINVGSATNAAATVGFTVPEGYQFVPYCASAKIQPISNQAYVKLELTDGTDSVSNEVELFEPSVITTSTLEYSEYKTYTGNVRLKVYCYGGGTGVTTFRLGTPITISGLLIKEEKVVLTTSQNMAGYRTYYNADTDYAFDWNTKAYAAKSVGNGKVVLSEISDAIPAGTPVILKTTGLCEKTTTSAYYQMTLTNTLSEEYTGENLLAVTEGGEDFSNGVYRLGYKEGVVGFYKWTISNATAGVVYINASTASAKLTIAFEGEEDPTAIEAVKEVDTDDNAIYYNVAGQRVDSSSKGLLIRNGKKFIKLY